MRRPAPKEARRRAAARRLPTGLRSTRGSAAWLLVVVIVLGCAVAAGLWALRVSTDRRYQLVIVERTPLLEEEPQTYPANNPIIGYLEPQQSVKVLRAGRGKDFQAFHVITPSGVTGWVVAVGGVKVVRR